MIDCVTLMLVNMVGALIVLAAGNELEVAARRSTLSQESGLPLGQPINHQ